MQAERRRVSHGIEAWDHYHLPGTRSWHRITPFWTWTATLWPWSSPSSSARLPPSSFCCRVACSNPGSAWTLCRGWTIYARSPSPVAQFPSGSAVAESHSTSHTRIRTLSSLSFPPLPTWHGFVCRPRPSHPLPCPANYPPVFSYCSSPRPPSLPKLFPPIPSSPPPPAPPQPPPLLPLPSLSTKSSSMKLAGSLASSLTLLLQFLATQN